MFLKFSLLIVCDGQKRKTISSHNEGPPIKKRLTPELSTAFTNSTICTVTQASAVPTESPPTASYEIPPYTTSQSPLAESKTIRHAQTVPADQPTTVESKPPLLSASLQKSRRITSPSTITESRTIGNTQQKRAAITYDSDGYEVNTQRTKARLLHPNYFHANTLQ